MLKTRFLLLHFYGIRKREQKRKYLSSKVSIVLGFHILSVTTDYRVYGALGKKFLCKV